MNTTLMSEEYCAQYRLLRQAMSDGYGGTTDQRTLKSARPWYEAGGPMVGLFWPTTTPGYGNGTRLLFVGWAANGCDADAAFSLHGKPAEFDNAIECAETEAKPPFFQKWLTDQWSARPPQYRVNRSPFWRTATAIAATGQPVPGPHCELAWTNLYKIAPAEPDARGKGNPPPWMQRWQRPVCRKLLTLEIEERNPSAVIFVTGADWFNDFWKDALNPPPPVNPQTGPVVHLNMEWRGRRWIVTTRPERRPGRPFTEAEFVTAVRDAVGLAASH